MGDLAAKALLVGAVYYAGAAVGFRLTSPSLPTSIFWLPNATMFAVFLLARPAHWWLYALAALPAHVSVQLQNGAPMLSVILLFPSNLGDGALAALAVRRFTRGRPLLLRARDVAVFLACAVIAPSLVSFVDAAIVTASGWASDYWLVWQTRFRSNVLTNFIWVPAVVIAATRGLAWLRSAEPRRFAEAAVLGVSLAAVAVLVFGVPGSTAMTPLLYAPLPLFLWAAARFETGGISTALLMFAFLVIWNATAGHGPFSSASAAQNTLSLQIFLTLTAAPFLLLAAMFGEHRRAKLVLADSESQYRGIFESTSDGILVTDAANAVSAVNPAFCRLTGYSAEKLRAVHPRTFLHLDDLQPLDAYLDAIGAAGPVTTQAMCVCADGRLARFELRGTRFDSAGGRPQVLSVVRDVTEREQALRLLEQKVAERTRELTTLLDISNTVASTLELKSVLGVVLAELQNLLPCSGATILVVDGAELVVMDHRGPIPPERVARAHFPTQWAVDWAELRRDSPLIIDNLWDEGAAAKAFRAVAPSALPLLFGYARSLLMVPMKARDRLLGLLIVDSEQPRQFEPRDAQLAWTLANQAAVAIENARLYDQGRELAAFEERQRLARELHDSVTQSLYTASMLGLALPVAWDRDPHQARQMLAHLRDVTTSALAELRTLLIELRPSVALQVELGELLQQLARALRSRIEKPVEVEVEGAAVLPAEVQVTFYRVAQAALGNIAKHAATSLARITLRCAPESATMTIADDGPGFDVAEATGGGRTGLDVMRDRAAAVGAILEVESGRGAGTRLTLRWPASGSGGHVN
jgi:PAS domain S-box-containing protein